MKKLLIFPLIISLSSYGQDAPKHAKSIIITGVDFNKACATTLDAGFMIERKDTADKTILTSYVKDGNYSYRLYLRQKDTVLYLTGDFKLNMSIRFLNAQSDPNTAYVIENKGMRGSDYRKAFDKMQAFAKMLGGRITFSAD